MADGVRVEGVDAVVRGLRHLADALADPAPLTQAGADAQAVARAASPVRTGRLAGDWRVTTLSGRTALTTGPATLRYAGPAASRAGTTRTADAALETAANRRLTAYIETATKGLR